MDMLQKGKTYYKIRNIKTMILDITRVSDPDPVFLPGSGSGFIQYPDPGSGSYSQMCGDSTLKAIR